MKTHVVITCASDGPDDVEASIGHCDTDNEFVASKCIESHLRDFDLCTRADIRIHVEPCVDRNGVVCADNWHATVSDFA